ncbi:hypothetical protein LTR66_006199 [Elasticomyces elasticus]|nr:hypothetical protein LTR66_006199 [Elasticomyces elasticus]
MSYRVSHHSTSDDSFAYRAKVEVEDWKRRDNPITRLRKFLESRDLWDGERDRALRSELRKDILAAFAKAEREKKPPLGNMMRDVYATMTEEQTEQLRALRRIIERYPLEYDVDDFEGGLDGLVSSTP